MDALKEFIIPIKGLSNSIYRYTFHVKPNFFAHFENTEIENGFFDVDVVLDKRPSFFEMTFEIKGKFRTDCDRCTASIELPLFSSQHLTVKMSEEKVEEDAEIAYIHPDTSHFNVAKYIYEFILLSMPLNRTYECEKENPRPCDMTVLKFLEKSSESEEKEAEKKKNTGKINPFDDLKTLFNSEFSEN